MESIKQKIDVITYKGACPLCGKVQESHHKSDVDVNCWDCNEKEDISKAKADLIDATVIDLVFKGSSMFEIILQKPNNDRLKLTVDYDFDNSYLLHYEPIDTESK